jgi:hypothetical protein
MTMTLNKNSSLTGSSASASLFSFIPLLFLYPFTIAHSKLNPSNLLPDLENCQFSLKRKTSMSAAPSAAKVRLEQELQRLESLLRLLDDFEHNPQDQQLLGILSKKLKVIVPELRALSLDPAYKTSE